MIDEDPRLFTAEIILNVLLSYRDIQVKCVVFICVCVHVCVRARVCVCMRACMQKSVCLFAYYCVYCVQDYESMIELVDKLPDHEQMQKPPIQMWYAFALNR